MISARAWWAALAIALALSPGLAGADTAELAAQPHLITGMWLEPPGDPRALPEPGGGVIELEYNAWNIFREKQDDVLTHLHRIRGPSLRIAYHDWDKFYSLTAADYSINTRWDDDDQLNKLDGHNQDVELEFGVELFDHGGERLILAARLGNSRQGLDGVLPATLERIPGFTGVDLVQVSRDGQDWLLDVRYAYPGGSIHGGVGRADSSIAIETASATDELSLNTKAPGWLWTIGLDGQLEQRVNGEVEFSRVRLSGNDRVYQHGRDIGILRASGKSQWTRLRLSDPGEQPRWDFSVIAGEYSSAISGSARLSGFDDSLLGITAPRGHLDAEASMRALTLMTSRLGGASEHFDWRYSLGLTRFDLDSRFDTWGTALFGAARLNDKHSSVPLEAGWAGHLGLSGCWDVGPGDLSVSISQSVPFATSKRSGDGPVDPAPEPFSETFDGGRLIGISYSISF